MVPDRLNGVRCTLTLFPAGPHALKSYNPPRDINSGELVTILNRVGRREVADSFLMRLISGKNAEAELSDEEAAHLFDSL
jgi:hypothetical protein